MKSSILEKIIAGLGLFTAFLILILLIGLFISFPVMWLWNACLVGFIPGIVAIEHWYHAWGILILCGLLFKSSKS